MTDYRLKPLTRPHSFELALHDTLTRAQALWIDKYRLARYGYQFEAYDGGARVIPYAPPIILDIRGPREGIFRDHRCSRCHNGTRPERCPTPERPGNCGNPIALNH